MSITFYLVRHALKEKRLGDVSITSDGIMQAQMTALYFKHTPITLIVSSPLRRAMETADYIALETEAAIELDNRLRERANWGDLPGQSFDEFITMWESSTRDPEYIPPIGDTAKQAGLRLSSLLSELVLKYASGSNIVIVAHGGLITDYLVHTYAEDELNEWHPHFIDKQSELVSECSITKIIYDEGVYRIEDFASESHL